MKITPGKQKGLEAVSDKRGVIAAAAMDQRGSLQERDRQGQGHRQEGRHAPDDERNSRKRSTRVLTPHASAILLDPEYGLSAAKCAFEKRGPALAYENSGYDNTQPGRLPDLLDHYSVRRIVADGADCVKILLYYTPFRFRGCQRNQARLGRAHRRRMSWRPTCRSSSNLSATRTAWTKRASSTPAKKPEIVTRSMEEFSKPQYAVDVLKVEVPVNMVFVKGAARSCKGESAYTRDEAKDHFRKAAAVAKKPFIYLSAGVSNETFNETLELAAEAGTNFSGVLCGRATWKDGMPVYAKQGLKALEDWLNTQGVTNIKNVNKRLNAAKPWHSFYGATSSTMA